MCLELQLKTMSKQVTNKTWRKLIAFSEFPHAFKTVARKNCTTHFSIKRRKLKKRWIWFADCLDCGEDCVICDSGSVTTPTTGNFAAIKRKSIRKSYNRNCSFILFRIISALLLSFSRSRRKVSHQSAIAYYRKNKFEQWTRSKTISTIQWDENCLFRVALLTI